MKTLSILLVCFCASATAQEIQVGNYFNNLGTLRNQSKEWKADEFPLKLVLMYYNGKTTINANAMNWLIEPDKSTGLATDDVKLVVGQGRSWAALKYDFTAPGTYTITALDRERNLMATTVISIEGPKEEVIPEPAEPVVEKKPEPVVEKKPEPVIEKKPEKVVMEPVETVAKPTKITKKDLVENAPEPTFVESKIIEELTEEEEETLKYESFYIAFGRRMERGLLMGQNEKFKAVSSGNYVEVLFSNNEGFNEVVNIDVWLKPKGGSGFDEHILDKKVDVPKGSTEANFHLSLRKRGTYKVSLFADDDVWIGSGYVDLY